MRRLISPFLLAAAACGGSDGATAPIERGPIHMQVVAGNGQSDTIGVMLATPIRVQAVRVDPATLAETPAANQLVNFVVVEEGCGRAFAGSAITDVNGNALDRWELGTTTGLCHMEVRTVDQLTGQPVVYASASAIIKPGVAINWTQSIPRVFLLSARVASGILVVEAWDRWGNVVENPSLILEPPAGWVATADSLFVPATETSGQLVIKSGPRSDEVRVTSVRDLRLNHWTTTPLKCMPADRVSTGTDSVLIDSVVVPLIAVDRVWYSTYYLGVKFDFSDFGDTPYFMYGYLEWSGVATYYLTNNTTQTRQLTNMRQYFTQRYPFTIDWWLGSGPADANFTMTSDNPISYSGDKGGWCDGAGWKEFWPADPGILTMTATP